MSSGMPELGSKISLISKADIRYEGRLFTVDPQECTIALASVRSFGTEDRETQYPVAPQSQVYDYILFRGTDIKDIRVLNNVPPLPNDPAIMQMSVPPTLSGGSAPGQFAGQFNHPVVGQSQYPQYHPMAGFPGSVHTQLNKTSSMLDLIGGGSQQNTSRSGTPGTGGLRKSPTADQSTQQVGNTTTSGAGRQARGERRGSAGQKASAPRNRTSSRNRQRYPSGGAPAGPSQSSHQPHQQHHHNQQQHYNHQQHHHQLQHHQQNHNQQLGYNRGGWRGRSRGRGRGFVPRNKINTLKFDNDYDFEQANTEFEELRTQLAKTKIADADPKAEAMEDKGDNLDEGAHASHQPPISRTKMAATAQGEVDKKDDSGNETGAGEAELDDDPYTGYDKAKSFFDNISCEAIERSKGRSQRTDWRTERKLNSETFGVASARRGAWRGRASWRHNPHNQHNQHQPWRPMRGGRGRGGMGGMGGGMGGNGAMRARGPAPALIPINPAPAPVAAPAPSTSQQNTLPATAAAK